MSSTGSVKKVKGGPPCGQEATTHLVSSPVGTIALTLCHQGLHTLGLEGNITDENFAPDEKNVVELVSSSSSVKSQPTVLEDCIHWLQQYFQNPLHMDDIPKPDICWLKNTDPGFYGRVWDVLARTVGPGEVISYGALAARLNNPGAVRAVGSAMRSNPVGIIVPCHRVVRASGLGLYHGGRRQTMKLWLLRHEGVHQYST